ncbi:MAG: bifunctional 2-polyprenyl-6-hydroxyphenol methylase/3-demethylubiquinol 3-O-methyltransferase UbiG [Alphaproteobacteria bacterium]
MTKQKQTFANQDEVKKFSDFAEDWWNPNGKMKPLHRFNPTRVSYIKRQICEKFNLKTDADKPLKGLKILDIGCGGGLLSESLALLGANVVGIDATEKMIEVAKLHAKQSGLKIDYRVQDVNDLAKTDEKFDVVLTLEVIEHVDNPDNFVRVCNDCVKTDGLLFVSTINRTLKAYGIAIIGAEYILRWLPKGTHEWHKFLKPSEICNMLDGLARPIDMTGVTYEPFSDSWKENKGDLDINYIITFNK